MFEELTEILLSDNAAELFTGEYASNAKFKEFIDLTLPEVSHCYGQAQRGKWHVYNVMEHILHSVEEMNKLTSTCAPTERKMLAYVMFLHDLGKPACHKVKTTDGQLSDGFKGHNLESEKIARRVLSCAYFDGYERAVMLTLVRDHDIFLKFSRDPKCDFQMRPTVGNLKKTIENLNAFGDGKRIFGYLILVGIADNRAQNPDAAKDTLDMILDIKGMIDKIQIKDKR